MSVLRPNKPDSSPCVSLCSHNVGGDVCTGCGRTVEEVRDWNFYTSEEKIEVKRVCQLRLEQSRKPG
ncbi:hypothetical protein D3C84_1209260 [compost metagenome]|jgi:predicted Fe-S protein YdhL (DUF1289 family)